MNKIGIIGAMELEVDTLKGKMVLEQTIKKANMEFCAGTLNGTPVVIVRSGVGKVNAAICAQILCDDFQVTHIINTGVAGSLKAEINIGDIVVSTDACYHDVDATIFGYALGEVPQLGVRFFEADKEMQEKAIASCKEVNPEIGVYSGRVVSGDQFIASREVKNKIAENFDGACTEMEGCSIAHVAFLNNVPFVILRAISDKADDSAEEDYPSFERKAAIRCAKLVENFVGRL